MAKESVEQIKEASDQLRGTLAEDLASDADKFDEAGKQLLKFHGIYQQEDRETRKERKKQKLPPLYFFMVRSRIPGGKLTAEQYLTHDRLADEYANGSVRLTSRQGIQFHGIVKGNLKTHIRGLNDSLISTLAACGDVERNIMCCPAPIRSNPVRDEMQALADRLAEHLAPRTTAYHEIWLNGEKAVVHKQGEDIEPIYGKHYLPRKFKTGIALPEDNCIDLLANDCGLLVKHDGQNVLGYDVFAGGGMGVTHGQAKTYPRLASPICFATPDQVIDAVTAVVKVQRDFGDREDRKQARLKYTIDRMGLEEFRKKVAEYYGGPLAPPSGATVTGHMDHLGWHEQGDGKLWVGVHVLSGRIQDKPGLPIKTTLREVVEKFRPQVRITADQNLLLCDVGPADRPEIDRMLAAGGLKKPEELSLLTRQAQACPAIPTCGLALADSERVLPDILDPLERLLVECGLGGEDIVLHMTGCPNGCVRPYNSDIGIVGRSPGKYKLYVGGNKLGDALSFELQDLVPQDEIPNVLRGPLLAFKSDRQDGERFGDFCRRVGLEALTNGNGSTN